MALPAPANLRVVSPTPQLIIGGHHPRFIIAGIIFLEKLDRQVATLPKLFLIAIYTHWVVHGVLRVRYCSVSQASLSSAPVSDRAYVTAGCALNLAVST